MIGSQDAKTYRLQMVQDALKYGIKPCARHYQTTVKTVRKWVKRYQLYKEDGLKDLSRKKHTVQSRLIKKQNCRLLNAVKLIQVGMPEESKKYWNSTTPMSLSIE